MLNNAPATEKESADISKLWNVVPKNLTEAISILDRTLPLAAKNELRTRAPGFFHHGFGRELRNRWKLWEETNSPLSEWFNTQGISHPDDMSGIILNSFHRYLQDKPIDLEGQIANYKEYWSHNIVDTVENIKNDIAAVKLQQEKIIEELNNTNLRVQSAIEKSDATILAYNEDVDKYNADNEARDKEGADKIVAVEDQVNCIAENVKELITKPSPPYVHLAARVKALEEQAADFARFKSYMNQEYLGIPANPTPKFERPCFTGMTHAAAPVTQPCGSDLHDTWGDCPGSDQWGLCSHGGKSPHLAASPAACRGETPNKYTEAAKKIDLSFLDDEAPKPTPGTCGEWVPLVEKTTVEKETMFDNGIRPPGCIHDNGLQDGHCVAEQIDDLRARLCAAEARAEEEKKRRLYYQTIVYDVCNVLDKFGSKIVCGTMEKPTRQVQIALEHLAKKYFDRGGELSSAEARAEKAEAEAARWQYAARGERERIAKYLDRYCESCARSVLSLPPPEVKA